MAALEQLFERRAGSGPDCTLLFPVWNGMKFIRESLPAALAQEGVRAEVLISDDSSQDGSLDALLEMARAYKGPHDVVVYRTTARAEVAHMPLLAAQARSEALIQAHQDDFSLPHRAQRLKAALAGGVYLVASAAKWRQEGHELPTQDHKVEKAAALETFEPFLYGSQAVLIGARYGMHADLFRLFPRIEPAYLTGGVDILLAVRAAILGEVRILTEKLLTCTMHRERWSFGVWDMTNDDTKVFSRSMRRLAVFGRAGEELASARERGLIPQQRHDQLDGWLKTARRRFLGSVVGAHENLHRAGFKLAWAGPVRQRS